MTAKKTTPKNDPEGINQEGTNQEGTTTPEIDPALEAELETQEEAEREILDMIARMATPQNRARYDQRWVNIAKTHIEQGFMALARATVNDG